MPASYAKAITNNRRAATRYQNLKKVHNNSPMHTRKLALASQAWDRSNAILVRERKAAFKELYGYDPTEDRLVGWR